MRRRRTPARRRAAWGRSRASHGPSEGCFLRGDPGAGARHPPPPARTVRNSTAASRRADSNGSPASSQVAGRLCAQMCRLFRERPELAGRSRLPELGENARRNDVRLVLLHLPESRPRKTALDDQSPAPVVASEPGARATPPPGSPRHQSRPGGTAKVGRSIRRPRPGRPARRRGRRPRRRPARGSPARRRAPP